MMSHVFESYFTNVEGATLAAHMSWGSSENARALWPQCAG